MNVVPVRLDDGTFVLCKGSQSVPYQQNQVRMLGFSEEEAQLAVNAVLAIGWMAPAVEMTSLQRTPTADLLQEIGRRHPRHAIVIEYQREGRPAERSLHVSGPPLLWDVLGFLEYAKAHITAKVVEAAKRAEPGMPP